MGDSHRRRQSVTGKLSRGVKILINNLTGTEIEIDQGRIGLTWFETDAYTDVTLNENGT